MPRNCRRCGHASDSAGTHGCPCNRPGELVSDMLVAVFVIRMGLP